MALQNSNDSVEQDRIVSVRPCWNFRKEAVSYVAQGSLYNLNLENKCSQ